MQILGRQWLLCERTIRYGLKAFGKKIGSNQVFELEERSRAMSADREECCAGGAKQEGRCSDTIAEGIKDMHAENDEPEIVDRKVTLLIAAGAAMAANCEPCLNKIVPDLIESGVAMADIRRAVEIGQFVKDKPAEIMKEAADMLTGTTFLDKPASMECPADKMKAATACG
jgi:hypothetical protein